MRHAYKEDREFYEDIPFREFIRKKRRILGMNQTDFGKFIGVHQTTISMWELGVTSPPFDEAIAIIERLGAEVSIRNLVEGTPDMPFGYCPWQE